MSERIAIEELRKRECFLALTPQQRALIEAYLTNGSNKFAATRVAYPHASVKSARTMSYAVFSSPNVIACLALAGGGDPEREKFNAELDRAIRNPKVTRTQIGALRLKAQTHGYLVNLPAELDAEAPKPPESRIPAGACGLHDRKTGALLGYRTASGEYVRLPEVVAEVQPRRVKEVHGPHHHQQQSEFEAEAASLLNTKGEYRERT